jgi:hypothetical protein
VIVELERLAGDVYDGEAGEHCHRVGSSPPTWRFESFEGSVSVVDDEYVLAPLARPCRQ